jgi:hypothetical protein
MKNVDIVMPRLDLGIPRRHGIMPALHRSIRVESVMKSPTGDAKIKSWHDDGDMTMVAMTHVVMTNRSALDTTMF